MKKNFLILLFIIPAAVAFAVYYGALSNGFIWDDPIVLSNQLSAFRSMKDVFFPPPGIPQFGIHYYRPIIIVTLLIDRKLWGGTPFGFHLSVVLFHVINTILVYFIARLLFRRSRHADLGALIASLLFAVHPIHTESVSWMAGRSDVVAALFFFSSLLLYMYYSIGQRKRLSDDRRWLYLLVPSVIAFFLAAGAKETSLSLLFLLPIVDLAVSREGVAGNESAREDGKRGKKEEKKRKREEKEAAKQARTSMESLIVQWWRKMKIANYFPYACVTVIYLFLRQSALKGLGGSALQSRNILDIPKYFLNSYGFYLEKLFVPINLKAYIPEVPGGVLYTLFSIVAFFGLLFLALWTLIKKREIFFFIIGFFIFTLLPSILVAVMKISETPLAERYLYIPSFSLSLLAGLVSFYIPSRLTDAPGARTSITPVIMVCLVGVMAAYATQTVKRVPVWKDDLLFWEDIVRKLPDEGLPHLNLGLAYNEADRIDDAEREYLTAIKSKYDDEGRSTAYNNLGNVYLDKKEYDRAIECFNTSISIRRTYPTPYYSIALTYWRKYIEAGQNKQFPDPKYIQTAIEYLNSAIQLNPHYLKAHVLAGNIYLILKRYDRARWHSETVLKYEQEGQYAELAKKILSKIPSQ